MVKELRREIEDDLVVGGVPSVRPPAGTVVHRKRGRPGWTFLSIDFRDEMLERLEAYRAKRGLRSRSQAIRVLVEEGLR